MKRAFPFHPSLVCLVPTLNLFAANISLLPGGSLWRPVLASLMLAAGLIGAGWLAYRDLEKSATFASFALAGVFGYSKAHSVAPHLVEGWVGVAGYCVALLGLAGAAGWFVRATPVLNVFASAMVIVLGANVGSKLARQKLVLPVKSLPVGAGVASGRLPDVYYIVLDGFGREDVLKEMYPLVGGRVAGSLRERGFYVADNSRANYCQTELSLASSLNSSHLNELIRSGPKLAGRGEFDQLVAHNSVGKAFAALGYEQVAVTTGFPALSFPEARTGYEARSGMSLLETALVEMTPLAQNGLVRRSQFVCRREWLTAAFDSLAGMGGDAAKPKFVVAHVLAPHPPFVFGPNGEPIQQNRSFLYADGSDYYLLGRSRADYVEGYSGQAVYIGKQLVKTIDAILEKSHTPPVIIVQGDHGPKSELDQNEIGKTNLDEAIPILNAYYGPEALKSQLYPGITPVNSFRVVFGALTGKKPDLVPDRSYYSPFGDPMDLTDVTDRLKK